MNALKAIERLERIKTYKCISDADKVALTVALEALRGNPCAVCIYQPPTAGDGRPCTICPAVGSFTEIGGNND